MKEKIINYIETLEAKSLQVDNYFKQRNELYISNQEKDKEIERLNNKLKDIKSQLDYLETYSSKEDVFEDMKRRLDRIESIVNRK